MRVSDPSSSTYRFEDFTLDPQTGELYKCGIKLKIQGQPLEILAVLLEHPGRLITRDELQKRLWPSDTFVDFETGLNAAVTRLREALGDSANKPRWIETVPRRGYRFIHPVIVDRTVASVAAPSALKRPATGTGSSPRHSASRTVAVLGAIVAVAIGGIWIYQRTSRFSSPQRTLTRLTFDEGLQTEPTWSPDGRLIAYSADHGGKFDIWVQQIGSGNPVRVTNRPGNNWQPDWSPDGKSIVYRSEDGEGGLYVAPPLGGAGLERKIASFGYYPRWSPDGTQICSGRI
jgi:Tol biopolymer transport system component/DNA-binding winged helix-turn-helix (wHTH) protein